MDHSGRRSFHPPPANGVGHHHLAVRDVECYRLKRSARVGGSSFSRTGIQCSAPQAVDKPPHPRAGIVTRRRATLFVHFAKRLSSFLGFGIALNQFRDCIADKGFTIYQTQISTAPLNCVAMDVCHLRFYVEHKPELNAWV